MNSQDIINALNRLLDIEGGTEYLSELMFKRIKISNEFANISFVRSSNKGFGPLGLINTILQLNNQPTIVMTFMDGDNGFEIIRFGLGEPIAK